MCEFGIFYFGGKLENFVRVGRPACVGQRKLLKDVCACGARVKFGIRNVRRVQLTDI